MAALQENLLDAELVAASSTHSAGAAAPGGGYDDVASAHDGHDGHRGDRSVSTDGGVEGMVHRTKRMLWEPSRMLGFVDAYVAIVVTILVRRATNNSRCALRLLAGVLWVRC